MSIKNSAGAREAVRPRRPAAGSWIAMPVLLLLFTGLFAALFSPLIGWARGDGTQGIFIARSEDCHKGCAWYGEFASFDHRIAAQNVR
jgi:hypothetical protein